MNMQGQGHSSGQISGQVPNQAMNLDPELVKARRFVQDKIKEYVMQRALSVKLTEKSIIDIVRRLDENLWRNACTKEYVNLETLENRLHALIRGLPACNSNQQYPPHVNPLSGMPTPGTTIPTPGMPPNGKSGVMTASSVGKQIDEDM